MSHSPSSRRVQTLYIERNPIDPHFCPVLALLTWLKLSGITTGPIFPAYSSNARTANLPGVRMNSNSHTASLSRLFKYVGGEMARCSSHSIRKAAVSWAARCGRDEADIQRCGRWKLESTSFRRYIQHGIVIQRAHLGPHRKTVDPVFTFWVFKTGCYDARA